MWTININTNESLYSQTQKTNLLPKGRGKSGWEQQIETTTDKKR